MSSANAAGLFLENICCPVSQTALLAGEQALSKTVAPSATAAYREIRRSDRHALSDVIRCTLLLII